MTSEEIRDLWSRFLAGEELSPEAQRTLVDALDGDPELRESLLENLQLDGVLHAMSATRRHGEAFVRTLTDCLGAEHDATRFIRKVESRLNENPPPPSAPPATGRRNKSDTTRIFRRRSAASAPGETAWKPALIAAAAFIAILLLVMSSTGQKRPSPQTARQVPTEPKGPPPPPPKSAPEEKPISPPPVPPAPDPLIPQSKPAPRDVPPETPPKPQMSEEERRKLDEELKKSIVPSRAPKSAPVPGPSVVATAPAPTIVERVDGNVYITRGKSDKVRLNKDDVVPVGNTIDTYPSNTARLRFGDGTWIEIGGGSSFREIAAPTATSGRKVFLASGTLESQITKQPADRPMIFATPTGEATILGTTIRLTVTNDPKPATTLEVKEGKVLLTRYADRKAVEVITDQFAVAAAGSDLVPQRWFDDEVLVKFGPSDVPLKKGWVLDSGEEFDPKRGYGWKGPREGELVPGLTWRDGQGKIWPKRAGRFAARRTTDPAADPLRTTDIVAGWANQSETWRMPIPNGRYLISVCCGDVSYEQGPHHVWVEGVQIIDQKINKAGLLVEVLNVPVEVKDGELNMVVGGNPGPKKSADGSTDTCINYLLIKRVRK
jgi:hypothetical protein